MITSPKIDIFCFRANCPHQLSDGSWLSDSYSGIFLPEVPRNVEARIFSIRASAFCLVERSRDISEVQTFKTYFHIFVVYLSYIFNTYTMKTILKLLGSLLLLYFSTACSSEEVSYVDIEGGWYRRVEWVAGTQDYSFTFNSDKTGVWNSQGRITQTANFSYQLSGNEIQCSGIYVNSNGHVSDWSRVMIYDGDKIYNKSDRSDVYGRNVIVENTRDQYKPTQGKVVDLGLSVKWAGWNLGATSPEEYGDYFSWAEITDKNNFEIASYIYYNQNLGKDISTSEYDAARRSWGEGWRMPTVDEIKELINKCTWTEFTYNGVRGNSVVGPNGNRIFIPLGGHYRGTENTTMGEETYLWSSTSVPDNKDAYMLYANPSDAYCMSKRRFMGLNIRPVID